MLKYLKYAILGAALVLLAGCGEKEVRPMEYFDVTVAGGDSEGTAEVVFDEEGFMSAMIEACPVSKVDGLRQLLTDENIDKVLDWSLDKESGLSNGDAVTLALNYDDSVLKKSFKIKFAGEKEKVFPVAGLEELTYIDAFDPAVFNVTDDVKGVHIKTNGASPLLTLEIVNDIDKKDRRSEIEYRQAKNEDGTTFFSSEDEVTITAELYGLEEDERLKAESATVSFPNAPKYMTSFDELSEAGWKQLSGLMKDFEDTHSTINENNGIAVNQGGYSGRAYLNDVENESLVLNWFRFEKLYLVTLKEGKDYVAYERDSAINKLVIPFTVSIDCDPFWDDPIEDLRGTGYIMITNPIINPDGTLTLENSDTNTEVVYREDTKDSLDRVYNEDVLTHDRTVTELSADDSRLGLTQAPAASEAPAETEAPAESAAPEETADAGTANG